MTRRRPHMRGPWIREGSTIGPLGPFRGRLGLHWVIAAVVVGALVLAAGIFAVTRLLP